MTFLCTMAVCILFGITSSETGSILPFHEQSMPGYSQLEPLPSTGIEEWTPVGPWGGNVKALVPAWSDDSIVLAGCGFSMTPDAGGVFRSTDGGASWSETELFPIPVNDMCSGGPAAPDRFYAATRQGLYRSDDLGLTWQTVSGMSTSYTIGIGVSLADPDILVAGLSSNNGVRRSDDGGVTWSEVGMSGGFMKGLGSDPLHPDTMYLAMSGLDYSLYRSVDAGLNWTPIGPAVSGWGVLVAPFGTGETIIVTTSDGFYISENYGADWTLAVSGSSYAPAVFDGSALFAPVIGQGVYESTDQGQTWTLNSQGIVANYWQAGAATSAGYLAGHYGGVYRTSGTGSSYTVSQEGIANGYFHCVSYSLTDNVLLAGGDHHGLWKSTNLGESWDVVTPGPGSWTIYDIAPQADLYYTGPVRYAATADGVYRSDDGGDSWAPAGLSGTQISSVEFDWDNPDIAWAGTATSGVHYTTDGGVTWTAGAGFPFALYPSIDLIETQFGRRILVSFQQNGNGVYYSNDGGANYTEVQVPGSYHPEVSSSFMNTLYPACFLASDQGIWKSTDDGETWNLSGSHGLMWDVLGGLDHEAFAGSNGAGVYYSHDRGSTWSQLNTGIEDKVVWDITYGFSPAQMFASIRGFGVYELTDEQLGVAGAEGSGTLVLMPQVNPVSSQVSFIVSGLQGAAGTLSVYSQAGRLVHSTVLNGASSVAWSAPQTLPSGVYLARLTEGSRGASCKIVLVR